MKYRKTPRLYSLGRRSERRIPYMVSPKSLWQQRSESLGTYAVLRREGATESEIQAAEDRLGVHFPTDIKAIMQESNGFGLPSLWNLSFSPSCTLLPVDLWFQYDDLGEIMGDPFDAGLRIVIGENPFGADYGYLVSLEYSKAVSGPGGCPQRQEEEWPPYAHHCPSRCFSV